ncbi:MAG: DUF302 domain-containing protein [Sulfuritalea sp.]|jgi:uncharacterized protein (DUF302 family)|nr:DUF302 domain-containing protein [Sulfuritalea sp.]
MLRNIARKSATFALCAGLATQFALAADEGVKRDGKPSQLPSQGLQGAPMPFNIQMPPTRPREQAVPNTMRESISPEARANFISSMMSINPFSMQDMIAMMAVKYPAKDGLTYDEVVEAMKLKANELNFKFVGHSPMWKDVVAITGKTDTPRVEFFSFCDAVVARDLLDLSLEFAIFLPCRVAVVEDANRKIWLLTLDWDARWLDTSKNPNQMSAKLRDGAIKIREAIDKIMRAGASGDF